MKLKPLKYTLYIAISLTLIACRTKEYYSINLQFQNQSDTSMVIEVFPKDPYIIAPHYNFYNINFDHPENTPNGGVDKILYVEPTHNSRAILVTANMDSEPIYLINQMFDSILIFFESNDSLIFKFYPDSVANYPVNCFTSGKSWQLEYTDHPAPCTMYCPNEHYYITQYIFMISDTIIH